MFLESLETYSDIVGMILLFPRVYLNDIDKDDKKHIQRLLKYFFDEIHEYCRSAGQTKGHNKELIIAITGSYFQRMIAWRNKLHPEVG